MYINTQTLTQHTESEIRALYPNTSFPHPFVAPDDYAYVFPAPQPVYDPLTQFVRQITPVQTALGDWEQRWEVVALDADTIAANQATRIAGIQAAIITSTQLRLDEFARSRNYDSILSACTYATSSNTKFAAEGQYCVDARDLTWSMLYTIMAEVIAGTRAMPESFIDVVTLLPILEWPA